MRGLAGVALLAAAALAGCTSAGSTVPPPSFSSPAAPFSSPAPSVSHSSPIPPASPPLTAVHNPDQGQVALYFGTDAGGFAKAWAGRGLAWVFAPQGRS